MRDLFICRSSYVRNDITINVYASHLQKQRTSKIYYFIQQIVTLSKYGHIAVDICHPYVTYIKQLWDEVEHDIVNYQNRGLCYEITQTRGFDNSRYHAKTELNICFIIHFSNNLQTKTFI